MREEPERFTLPDADVTGHLATSDWLCCLRSIQLLTRRVRACWEWRSLLGRNRCHRLGGLS